MNIWNNFWKSLDLRPNSSWKNICNRFSHSDYPKCSLSQKFMALAYRDSQISLPSNVESMKKIAEDLGFDYSNFYSAKNDFEKELLEKFSIVLLRSSDGSHRQFMRTIRRFSGKMYVEFADKIGTAIRQHGWSWISDPQKLNGVLGLSIERYSVGNEKEQENTLSLADTANFFLTLINLYRKYNQAFSLEDILATDLGQMLTPKIAESIIKKMCVDSVSSLTELDDTMPVIQLQDEQVVISLPEIGKFNNCNGLSRVVFQFYSTPSATKPVCFCRYDLIDGKWKRSWALGWDNGVPLEDTGHSSKFAKIRYIKRVKVFDSENEEADVTPQVLNGHSYILLSESENNIVSETVVLELAHRYKVISLDGEGVKVYALQGEEKNEILQGNGFFTVPEDAEQIIINDNSYDTKCNRNSWICKDERFKCIKNGGVGRLFFERSAMFLNENSNSDDIEVLYKLDNEDIFPVNDYIPDEFLWQRNGRLIISHEGTLLLTVPITFIPDVDQRNLKKTINYGEHKETFICFEDEKIDVTIEGTSSVVEVEYRGYYFSFPINREGIYLQSKERGIFLPLRREQSEKGNTFELAREDFEYLNLMVNSSENSTYLLTRGNKFREFFPEHRREKIHWYCSNDPELANETSNCYSIVAQTANGISVYKIHKYDTLSAKFSEDGQKSYDLKKENGGYTLSYFISHYYSRRKKKIIIYKATCQEESPIELTPESVTHQIDEYNRCIETLHFKLNEDYKSGLICFAAFKTSSSTYTTVSSGFFLSSTCGSDAPVGELREFRLALDSMDYEIINQFMTTNDEQIRTKVKDFIKKLTYNAQKAKIAKYLNSFRNELIIQSGLMSKIPCGYLFMAGWFWINEIDRNGNFNADFREFWDPLMIAYQYQPNFDLSSTIDYENFVKDYCSTVRKMNDGSIVKKLRDLIKSRVNRVDNKGECFYNCEQSFFYTQFSETMKRMVEKYRSSAGKKSDFNKFIIKEMPGFVEDYKKSHAANTPKSWHHLYLKTVQILFGAWYDGRISPCTSEFYRTKQNEFNELFKTRYIVKYFIKYFPELTKYDYVYHDGYDHNIMRFKLEYYRIKGFSSANLSNFVCIIAKELHEWRKAPDLHTAQKLREVLLSIQEIDNDLFFYLQSVTNIKTKDFVGLRKVIDSVAWDLYKEEKLNTEVC